MPPLSDQVPRTSSPTRWMPLPELRESPWTALVVEEPGRHSLPETATATGFVETRRP
ncbi:hypothetical protein [Streptomyces sp. NPDC047071]|uniref:hypothetical protein n=1 Tax=Streptomyces sp. NPDC047071 TaxID=3154808 RepID=UPI00345464A2